MVSSLGGEMIKGAGVPWLINAITWNAVKIRKQVDVGSDKVKLSCFRDIWKYQTNWADNYQNMSQPHAAAPLSHAFMLHCCLSFPHLLFLGSPPFHRDVNLATGWNNVRKRQVVMIYPQAMVASIESQLQHLSDDDDNSSLSDREERRLTRPQATASG